MIKIKIFFTKIILSLTVLFLPIFFLQADGRTSCADGKVCNPLSNINSIEDFLKTILEGAIKIGIPIIVLAIIYSGFLFVKARGNPEQITKAKDALTYTLIGSAILLGSWAIAQLITDTITGISFINLSYFS
jgi:hypothetical protein